MMNDREFTMAFVLARASAISGKFDIHDAMCDAEDALNAIDERHPLPAVGLTPPSAYPPPRADSYSLPTYSDDDIPF